MEDKENRIIYGSAMFAIGIAIIAMITVTLIAVSNAARIDDSKKVDMSVYLQAEQEVRLLKDQVDFYKQANEDLEGQLSTANAMIESLREQQKTETETETASIDTQAYYEAAAPEMPDEISVRTISYEPEINYDLSESTNITNLSADEFNELIKVICEHRDIEYTECPFYNTGDAFEYVESEYGINGIYLLTICTIESGFGSNMIRSNNAAGITNGDGYIKFESINDCILYLGELLGKYNSNYNLSTFEEIGSRYLEDSEDWVNMAQEISSAYSDMLYKIND